MPARRIDTNTVFLPSITGDIVFSSGVSISINCVGMSRVTSYAISIAISFISVRKLYVLRDFSRINVSLCWISGCDR